ncbi:MAG: hypothetical protein ACOX58_00250 [Christensenellales bacterium]|jgi:hypothetical protein|nr:hypothetical protein [Fastidiosipila sp.]
MIIDISKKTRALLFYILIFIYVFPTKNILSESSLYHFGTKEQIGQTLAKMKEETDFSGLGEEEISSSLERFLDYLYDETDVIEYQKSKTTKDSTLEKPVFGLVLNFDAENTDGINLMYNNDNLKITFKDEYVKKLVYSYFMSIVTNIASKSGNEMEYSE